MKQLVECVNCGGYHVGYFKAEKDAAIAYNKKAKALFGEYARFNEVCTNA